MTIQEIFNTPGRTPQEIFILMMKEQLYDPYMGMCGALRYALRTKLITMDEYYNTTEEIYLFMKSLPGGEVYLYKHFWDQKPCYAVYLNWENRKEVAEESRKIMWSK